MGPVMEGGAGDGEGWEEPGGLRRWHGEGVLGVDRGSG